MNSQDLTESMANSRLMRSPTVYCPNCGSIYYWSKVTAESTDQVPRTITYRFLCTECDQVFDQIFTLTGVKWITCT